MLGIGGAMVGGLALLVDRAADPGPTPALVATERAAPAAPAPPPPPPSPHPSRPRPAPAASAPADSLPQSAPVATRPKPTATPSAGQADPGLTGAGPTAGRKLPLRAPTPPRETPERLLDAAEVGFQEGRFYDAVTMARRGWPSAGQQGPADAGKDLPDHRRIRPRRGGVRLDPEQDPDDSEAREGRRKAVEAMGGAARNPPRAGK